LNVRKNESNHEAEPARERIAEILRTAMGAPEEEALEDETRRLMLQLSIEPPDAVARVSQAPASPAPARMTLLQRLLRKPGDVRT
jgi:hypothetical protein